MIDKTLEKKNEAPLPVVEESKEKPEPSMNRNKYPPAHQAKLSMEEIKETKAENEDIQSQSTQGHFNQNEASTPAPANPPKAPVASSSGPSMKKRLDDAQAKKMKLQTQLKRLEDNKGVLGKKDNAVSGAGYSGAEASEGFKMHHLIAMSVFGLLVGAYAQIYYLSNPWKN